MSIADLDAVFVTHVHGDHVNQSTVLKLYREHIPIYCPIEIEPHLKKKYHYAATAARHGLLRPIATSEVTLDHLCIRSFKVPHDSDGGCFGYSILHDDEGVTKKVSISTDLANATQSAVEQMANSDVIVIESNYDVKMLEASARPAWLKRRIQQDGHLSNDQCAESLLQIIDKSDTLPSSVALAHVSRECNTNKLAHDCTKAVLDLKGIGSIKIFETHPDQPGHTITV
jgi:phosphoribosyl 1,2-cyclic phosphodiesterase